MTTPSARRKTEKVVVTVLVECIACYQQMDIQEDQFGTDDYPCCNRCGSPVVAIKAERHAKRLP